MVRHERARQADRHPECHEHRREADDERGGRPEGSTGIRRAGADRRQIGGHERQDARSRERDEARGERCGRLVHSSLAMSASMRAARAGSTAPVDGGPGPCRERGPAKRQRRGQAQSSEQHRAGDEPRQEVEALLGRRGQNLLTELAHERVLHLCAGPAGGALLVQEDADVLGEARLRLVDRDAARDAHELRLHVRLRPAVACERGRRGR